MIYCICLLFLSKLFKYTFLCRFLFKIYFQFNIFFIYFFNA